MQFRDIRFGVVLFPIGVATVLIGALTWYGFARVPARENYLNERNLRLLSTVSGAIKAKIDSFDGALDNAVRSFKPTPGKAALERFQQCVRLFAPDLEVLALEPPVQRRGDDSNAPETRLLKGAADPPRVLVERDQGRYYLYLGAGLEDERDNSVVKVVARSNLEVVLGPLLDGKNEFDAVVVTTVSGEVVAQNSSVGLTLARLDGAINAERGSAAGKDKDGGQPSLYTTLSAYSNMVTVNIGNVPYQLYMQPISFSLLSISSQDEGRRPEQWVLCGLVRSDRFRAESSALSYTTLLWLSGILAIFALSLSFVKLRAISPRERLRSTDTRWVTATTFMAVGLLTLGALDIWAFGSWFRRAIDQRLQSIATQIASRVNAEVVHINRQGNAFEGSLHDDFSVVTKGLDKTQVVPTIMGEPDKGLVSCKPNPACRLNLLDAQSHIDVKEYPFFDQVTWSGTNGWQRVRWTPGRSIKPFINIFDEKLLYAERARAAWRAPRAAAAMGVDIESSPTTGDPLTAFWRTGPPDAKKAPREQWVQSLAVATLVSLDRPILPKGVSFAVVDQDGLVLFHSSPNRRLHENFLTECEDNGHLRALLQNGQTDQIQARYRGRDVDMSVSPLKLTAFDGNDDPGWRLVIMQDAQIVDTVNLETVTIACWLFTFYACLLAIVGTMTVRLGLQRRHWFWPDPRKRSAYWMATLVNAAVVGIFVAIFRIGTAAHRPDAILIWTLALTIPAAIATYVVVVYARTTDATDAFGCRHPFYLARAALLIVIATLPAAACFHAAYAFETMLLAKDEIIQRNIDATNLNTRIDTTVAQIGRSDLPVARRLGDFLSEATYVPLWPEGYVPAEKAAKTATFNSLLLMMHRRYNDSAVGFESAGRAIANDLELTTPDNAAPDKTARDAAMPAPAPPPAPNTGWLLAGIVAVFMCCHVFVYWLVRPMFVLGALAPRSVAVSKALPSMGVTEGLSSVAGLPSRNVLIFGPPGSGKSTALARQTDMRVFDVARRAWVERRRKAVPVPKERRRALLGAVVGGFRHAWREPHDPEAFEQETVAPAGSGGPVAPSGGGWADTFDYTRLPGAIAIDHVDFRLEEHEFASQTLTFVEHAVYRDGCTVQIVGDRDPLACLRESGAPDSEMDRWVRALGSFQRVIVSVPASNQDTPQTDASAAAPYYESLWNACSIDERLTLRQLAEEGVLNPQNQTVVRNLMQDGLIVRDPAPRIMDPTFREFVLQAVSPDQITAWERRGVVVPWGSIEIALLTGIVVLAGLLLVTQEQLLNAWIGFIPVLLPVAKPTAETVWKLFSAMRPSASKDVLA